jgi:hypothetical protein
VVGGSVLAMALWWVMSSERRVASYAVRGTADVVTLDLGAADAELVGVTDDDALFVRRTERFAFGHGPVMERDASGGRLTVRARCPETVLGACSSSYRLEVPPNVKVLVRTTTGDVRIRRYRGSAEVETASGDVAVEGFCGFSLEARAVSGDVIAATRCQIEQMELRSRTGDVRAVVPPGRYQLDAVSDAGERHVDGVMAADDAAYRIQALSSTGDVSVEGAS